MTMPWPLRCPECSGPSMSTPGGASCTSCGHFISSAGGYLDVMPSADAGLLDAAETDYDVQTTLDAAPPFVHAGWRAHTSAAADLARSQLPIDARVVWLGGGGENRLSRALVSQLAAEVVIDPSVIQLRMAPLLPNGRTLLLRGLAEDLPLEDDWADMTELQGVLDHVVSPPKAIAEAIRVTRPGGLVMVTMTNADSWYRRVAERLGDTRHLERDTHQRRFGAIDVSDLLADAGLQSLKVATVMYFRLPRRVDVAIGSWLGPDRLDAIMRVTDRLGSRVAPTGGGMLVVAGQKP